jgi:hypothetical protein
MSREGGDRAGTAYWLNSAIAIRMREGGTHSATPVRRGFVRLGTSEQIQPFGLTQAQLEGRDGAEKTDNSLRRLAVRGRLREKLGLKDRPSNAHELSMQEPPKQPPPPHEIVLADFPEDRFAGVRAKIAEYIASIPDLEREITSSSPLAQGLLLGFTEREVRGLELKYRLQGVEPQSDREYQEAIQRREELVSSARRFEQHEEISDPATQSDRDQAKVLGNSFRFGHLWSGELITDCYALIPTEGHTPSAGDPAIDVLHLLIVNAQDTAELYKAGAHDDVIADIRELGRDAQLEDHIGIVEREITATKIAQGILHSVIDEFQGKLSDQEGIQPLRLGLEDIQRVGLDKPIGYLPRSYVEERGHNVEQLIVEARKRGLYAELTDGTHLPEECLYIVDPTSLQAVFDRHPGVFGSFTPTPEEYIGFLANTTVPGKTELFDTVADTFADTTNRGRTNVVSKSADRFVKYEKKKGITVMRQAEVDNYLDLLRWRREL